MLASAAIPEPLWREALESLSFVAIYTDAELERLRELAVMFLTEKSIVGGGTFEVTPVMRVAIAIQACVLILNLDPRYFDGWENVIVYPDEFVNDLEFEDEAGVVHRRKELLSGEAIPGGPVVLSWPDVEAGADWVTAGMNLVIHEFAHKLDMRSGDANGCPPLPGGDAATLVAEGDECRVRALQVASRARRGNRDRPLRGREPRRVLRRSFRSLLCRPDAAAARVPEDLRAFLLVLQAGSREPNGVAARGVIEPGVGASQADALLTISAHRTPAGRVPSAPLPKRSRRDAQYASAIAADA